MKKEVAHAYECVKPIIQTFIELESTMFQDMFMVLPILEILYGMVTINKTHKN